MSQSSVLALDFFWVSAPPVILRTWDPGNLDIKPFQSHVMPERLGPEPIQELVILEMLRDLLHWRLHVYSAIFCDFGVWDVTSKIPKHQ